MGPLLSALKKKQQAPADFQASTSISTASEKAQTLKQRYSILQASAVLCIAVLEESHSIHSLLIFLQERRNAANLSWLPSTKQTGREIQVAVAESLRQHEAAPLHPSDIRSVRVQKTNLPPRGAQTPSWL